MAAASENPRTSAPLTVQKLTPVLVVDAIEPCLSFWVDRLGFEKTVEVPEGNARIEVLGFRASIFRSARRLKAIAVERAPTIASTIQTS